MLVLVVPVLGWLGRGFGRSGGSRPASGLVLQRDAVRLQRYAQQAGVRLQVRPLHGGHTRHPGEGTVCPVGCRRCWRCCC